ncbi:protein ERGIC-53-like [Branchiostoma lanceolatum]|uniref:protein ERGIC-53-like n=1 Tax=Branchiostoma lanceolatum TaxID=7740 RepID=UPI003454C9A4
MAATGRFADAFLLIFFVFLGFTSSQTPHKRFEYKLSFKGPHLVQKNGKIPFWDYSGHSIASDEQVRITPSLRSKRGSVWSTYINGHDHWYIEVTIRVTGRGRIGADGLAIWYTKTRGLDGPVYGSSDRWNGVGVFFDSFDNDNQHNNPYVLVMQNDGTKSYNHANDGLTQQLGGCLRDFRNKPYPVRAKLEYYQNRLTLWYNNGMTPNKDEYELCMQTHNIHLEKGGFFGVSAATGGLADDHDVLSFLFYSLTPPTSETTGKEGMITDEERQRFTGEFDEYQQKFEKQREEYVKEHPDAQVETEFDAVFEREEERELRLIFEGQEKIHKTVRDLQRKLDEIIGRQERTLSLVGAVQQNMPSAGSVQAAGAGGGQPAAPMPIQRHEVDAVLTAQRELTQGLRDLRSKVDTIHNRAATIESNQQRQIQGQGQGGQGLDPDILPELRDNLHHVKRDVSSLLIQRPSSQQLSCPQIPEYPQCITPVYFLILIFVQSAAFVLYLTYKSRQEAASKKFY